MHEALRQVVRQRSRPYDLERPTQHAAARFGESEDVSTTTITDVDIWVYDPQEVNVDTEFGDRLSGDLQALALPNADVEVHDRLTHGVDSYEVERVMHLPDNDRQKIKKFALNKRTNE
jgi:hypothetical protein